MSVQKKLRELWHEQLVTDRVFMSQECLLQTYESEYFILRTIKNLHVYIETQRKICKQWKRVQRKKKFKQLIFFYAFLSSSYGKDLSATDLCGR